ncbi:MAG: DUF1697 domain-containing protein [Pseudomonadota bacterium]
MNLWIVLLRGINVGGHNTLRMAPLKSSLESEGFTDVLTYLQSGNLVCRSDLAQADEVQAAIKQLCQRVHGLSLDVWVGEAKQWTAMIDDNPFPQADVDPKSVHLFLAMHPIELGDSQLERLQGLTAFDESMHIQKSWIYLQAPSGIGRSKIAASMEKVVGQPLTARNWRTVQKIAGLIQPG